MKLICPLSGVSYHTSVGYGHGKAPHPMFYMPLDSLIQQNLTQFCEGKLSQLELHLFGCALLHKLPVIWEVALDAAQCDRVWKSKIEKLAAACLRLDDRERAGLPHYHIDKHNSSLHNLGYYLESINTTINEIDSGDYDNTYIQREAEVKIVRILRQTLNKAEKQTALPILMADWALEVAQFPTYDVPVLQDDGVTTKKLPLSQFWHGIVLKAFQASDAVDMLSTQITAADIDELVEHCEHNIEVGTVHSSVLLRKLRDIRDVLDEFRSPAPSRNISIEAHSESLAAALLGDEPVPDKSVSIDDVSTTSATITDEPIRKDYPSMGAYIAAKLKWQRGK